MNYIKPTDIFYSIILNAVLLIFIALCVIIYKKMQPMTVKRLRESIKPLVKPTNCNPFIGNFSKMRMMLAVLEDYVPYEKTICALLISWNEKGIICLKKTPKKRLQSFGEDEQESILFLKHEDKNLIGAEKMFFEMLSNWTDQTDILQKSELYQLARKNSSLVFQRMEQFVIEGKHGLRASGQMHPEKKRRHFGFLDEQRAIFTERGVREAAQLKSYQIWLQNEKHIERKLYSDAVLLNAENAIDDKDILCIAKELSKIITTAANAGNHQKSLGD